MTNFERYAESQHELERLLSAATDAALRAKGCSMKLDFPPDGDWEAWLKSDETELSRPPVEPPEFLTPEQHNAKAVTDKLIGIRDAIGRRRRRVNRPYLPVTAFSIRVSTDTTCAGKRRDGGGKQEREDILQCKRHVSNGRTWYGTP